MSEVNDGFDISKPGKYKVQVGDNLKNGAIFDSNEHLESGYISFRYNAIPPELSDDGEHQIQLKPGEDGKYLLDYAGDEDEILAKYSGAQRPGRKLECILLYNPDTNAFTLERLASTFTFNQEFPDTSEPQLPTHTTVDKTDTHQWAAQEPVSGSEGEEALADVENPYDVRHFVRHRKDDESMDDEDGDDEDDSDADEEAGKPQDTPTPEESAATPGVMKASTPIPIINVPTSAPRPNPPPKKRLPKKSGVFMPKAKQRLGGKSPLPGGSPLAPAPTSAPAHSRNTGYNNRDMSMSPASALPSPVHLVPSSAPPVSLSRYTNTPRVEESSSDEDEDDEDDDNDRRPPPKSLSSLPVPMSREVSGGSLLSGRGAPDVLDLPSIATRSRNDESDEDADGEDDDMDLLAEMEEMFESGDDRNSNAMVIEGEEPSRGSGVGLGIGGVNMGNGPITLGGLVGGGRRRDESEESSSEEE